MKRFLAFLTTLSALLGLAPFIRPRSRSGETLMWVPKLLGGALSPILGLIGVLGALVGLVRRDWKLAGTGLVGVALAARLIAEVPDAEGEIEAVFGPPPQPDLPADIPIGRESRTPHPRHSAGSPQGRARFERDLVFGHSPKSGRALLADLWQPPAGTPPSGLGLIYAHGSGWRVGDKDMGTRPFFRRLAAQGHVVLDIAYTLWPRADLPTMVAEVNQAILWLKESSAAYGVSPERIVLMGGSAGAHLALMAAYTPNHPAFRPAEGTGDTTVRGVVAFYPPVDFLTSGLQAAELVPQPSASPIDRVAEAMMKAIFRVEDEDTDSERGQEKRFHDIIAEMLGGTIDEIPATYRLLSPISHVGAHCPPTLLLQGSDDVFALAPAVRRLHERLRAAGVPAVLVEFLHTEHAFDLVLPHISPMAQAATRDVERFLAMMG